MRAHVIKDGKVENTIEVAALDILPNLIDASMGGKIGDDYDAVTGAFNAQPIAPSVPQVVSRFQAIMALRNAELFDAADAAMNDPETPIIAKEAWRAAQEFRRTSPTIASMAVVLGLTDQRLDELFIAAASIEA